MQYLSIQVFICMMVVLVLTQPATAVSIGSTSCSEPSEHDLRNLYKENFMDLHESFYMIPVINAPTETPNERSSLIHGNDQTCDAEASGSLSGRSLCPYHYVLTYDPER